MAVKKGRNQYERLVDQLEELRCPACLGEGRMTRKSRSDFYQVVICDRCNGVGLKPHIKGVFLRHTTKEEN